MCGEQSSHIITGLADELRTGPAHGRMGPSTPLQPDPSPPFISQSYSWNRQAGRDQHCLMGHVWSGNIPESPSHSPRSRITSHKLMVDRSHESSGPETGIGGGEGERGWGGRRWRVRGGGEGGEGVGRHALGKATQQIQVSLKELLAPFSQPGKKKLGQLPC